MARAPISLVENQNPQVSEGELMAEIEIEAPGPLDMSGVASDIDIEMDDDGGAMVDFDPMAARMESGFNDNLAEDMDDRVMGAVASELMSDFDANKASRQEWEDAYANGLELLGFNYSERTEPFRGASGVTHPLLAEAAVQFQAQAFNELLPAGGPVRTAVVGSETNAVSDQAQRVKDFMNYYITNVMEEYTPEFDQMLFFLPLAGSTFKKVYYDESIGRAVSKFIPAENLIVPYETADLETCPNITHVVRMSLNELRKRQIAGFYRDITVLPQQADADDLSGALDELTGLEPSSVDYDCTLLECHVDLDLEGYEDVGADGEPTGIKLPYVVTISQDNGQILSIRRNYREDDEEKKKIQYFVHYKFLPGFGFYGLGLIHTIGGLSRTATAALRQLIDAGTLSNLPAGFKARGLRIRDDDDPLQPGEFRDVDAPGGAIRDSLMPLPFKGPDGTLFQLLGFVVDAGRRFATITDMKVGDGNQQAAVGTTIALMEQGSRVMSAVHKRLHYAMKVEFKLLAKVMGESLPPIYPYALEGVDSAVKAKDFDGRIDVIPVSNPNVFSQAQRIALAQTKMQLAAQAPQMHNMYEVYRDMYEALGVRDIDKYLKNEQAVKPVPKDPAQENMDALDGVRLMAFPMQSHQAHIMAHLVFAGSPLVATNPALATALQKHVMQHVQIDAREKAAQQLGMTGQEKQIPPQVQLQLDTLSAQFMAQGLKQVQDMGRQLSQANKQDPVVALKQQELQLDAVREQNDQMMEERELNQKEAQMMDKSRQFDERIQSQEEQTAARIAAAREREMLKMRSAE